MTIATGNLTDRQLLEQFVTRRDEEAFAQLVQRHGPMVLGVCRQILRQEQDAEDAFQATFLVLSRKAGSIRSAEALPNWLYGVANRLAARLKAAASRRQTREVALVDAPTSEPGPGGALDDLGPILHEEIGRLPDKYRIPFVLCYLEGKTNEEAARELGCPPGTVFSRLARAREGLRARLTRRGLVLPSTVFAATILSLSQETAAAVSSPLVSTTVHAAIQFSAGRIGSSSDVPARVVELAEWGVKTRSGRWFLTVVLVLIVLVGAVGGLLLWLRLAERPIHERLQGTWAFRSMRIGQRVFSGMQGQLTLEGEVAVLQMGQGMNMSWTYRIDPDKKPMRMYWMMQGAVMHGIFELRGDELTICFAQPEHGPPPAEPPADFSPRPGTTLYVFQRVRP
jgi:RNA polymerase sigma factor (sigma-70 family)